MLPLVQKTKESSGSHHISVATESSKAGPAEAPQDAGIDTSTQINRSVKEECEEEEEEEEKRGGRGKKKQTAYTSTLKE